MPRPVSTLEPVVIDSPALTGHRGHHLHQHLHHRHQHSALGMPSSLSSSSLSLSSPPAMDAQTAWGLQWDSIDEMVYDKEELNLAMSVPSYRRHGRMRALTPEIDDSSFHSTACVSNGPVAPVLGFMDEAMKQDGFIPLPTAGTISADVSNVSDPLGDGANNSAFSTIASVNPQHQTAGVKRSLEEFSCPCCGLCTPGGISYHTHVTQCYINRFMQSAKNQRTPQQQPLAQPQSHSQSQRQTQVSSLLLPDTQPSPSPRLSPSPLFQSMNSLTSSNADSIANLRAAVSNLDLHDRIGLMEAFFRLSRSAAAPAVAETAQPFHADEGVINLLYSPPTDNAEAPTVATPTPLPALATGEIRAPVSSPSLDSLAGPHSPTPVFRSPSLSPRSHSHVGQLHTCLTPALGQWEMADGKEDELHAFSLHDLDYGLGQGNHLAYTLSAPSSPASAFKRSRALSQPHVHYSANSSDDFNVCHRNNTSVFVIQPQLQSGSGPSQTLTQPLRSPQMRSYSPVQVHVQPPSQGQWSFTPAVALALPSAAISGVNVTSNSLAARRHIAGQHQQPPQRTVKIPAASKDIFGAKTGNSPGVSVGAVDGLTFNAGSVSSPPSSSNQPSPVHGPINTRHSYAPSTTKHKRGKVGGLRTSV